MNRPISISRRGFLKAASTFALVAPVVIPSRVWSADPPPGDRIALGFIGVGFEGDRLLQGFLRKPEARVVAVCDVDTTRRQYHARRVDDYYAKQTNTEVKGCAQHNDFRELIARPDVDAVVIATPDHWHAIQTIQAANAKKDIYCEKPLSLTLKEARAMVNAVRQNGRVLQTGSQQRSSAEYRKGCEYVRNGRIGRVKQVVVHAGSPSNWCDLPGEQMEPGLDWNLWLGPAPMRSYHHELSPRRDPVTTVHQHFPTWRNYREFSGGFMTDWGAHDFDIAQWGLGMDESGPVEIIPPEDPNACRGLRFIYANGVEMIHSDKGGVTFKGTEGEIYVNRGVFKATPESIANTPITDKDIRLYQSGDHLQDFLNCVRSRQRPIADVEVGCRSATVCHLADLAYWNHRRLKWDPARERFVDDEQANTWLDGIWRYGSRRAPWKLG